MRPQQGEIPLTLDQNIPSAVMLYLYIELQSRTKFNETTDILHESCVYSLFGTLFWPPSSPQYNFGSCVS